MSSSVPDIASLAGEQLSSVCFVADYVELDFNGPVVRALAPPYVRHGASEVRLSDAGSRDALCQLIHRVVQSADANDSAIRITFDGDLTFVLPLEDHANAREIAHFIPSIDGLRDGTGMSVWENRNPAKENDER